MIVHKRIILWTILVFLCCHAHEGKSEERIIFPFGDSITKGWSIDPDHFGYRDHLQDSLTRKYDFVGPFKMPPSSQNYDVDHGGYSGQRTDQLKEQLKIDLPLFMANVKGNGSSILIHAGTNDIDQDYGRGSVREKIDGYVDNIREMIDTLDRFNPEINVFVALIIPINDTRNHKVKIFNEKLAAMLRLYAKDNLQIVDMYDAFLEVPLWSFSLMGDNLHPNDAGYSVMAKKWADQLNSL